MRFAPLASMGRRCCGCAPDGLSADRIGTRVPRGAIGAATRRIIRTEPARRVVSVVCARSRADVGSWIERTLVR